MVEKEKGQDGNRNGERNQIKEECNNLKKREREKCAAACCSSSTTPGLTAIVPGNRTARPLN